ncbi:U6 small nuclear RNA (adenine-(43)-N(6))-methyltransferase [Sitophilus oryzae]|uniref:U6 small nuclear RNA (adenine-(43)-N(6))-methyltransferase n=1 Tax=Sitophilus oryzae TaxID=7048 RepID=A0A6J2Y992_SITOR|nr:U6 small nuclear RNA (adenine-(43)-N(6))-methyltransferase [Sitophilus oryzae]
MSMNKFMHPRNIYKSPPDFKALAVEFSEFKNHVKLDIAGKTVFDFKDPEALRALSRALLKKDFDLDVEIPKTKLIPTIPLRLNYILWIEDLLEFVERENDIKGIDIGTGASCVYPLMAAKKNKWFLLATETDKDSIACARSNVDKNNLSSFIKVLETTGDTLLTDIIKEDEEYDFCMCNPPFFSSTQELHPFFKSRTRNRPHPKNAFVASVNEVVAKGGEVEFIQKLIAESKVLGDRVKLYTTMVGQKSDLPALKKSLRDINIHSFKEAEFCQGNTTRWGLAWTFLDCDLRKAPDIAKLASKSPIKNKAPLIFELSDTESTPENVLEMTKNMLELFKKLQMTIEEVTRNKLHQRFFVSAYSNTWSHQRRKRRQKLRQSTEEKLTINNNSECEIENTPKSPGKRTIDDICESTTKKLRLSTESDSNQEAVFYKFLFAINCDKNKVYIELNTLDEESNREYLHQILQYIKNNFDKTEDNTSKNTV